MDFDYITIDNISFIGSIADAVEFDVWAASADYCSFQKCSISFAGLNGISIRGNYDVISIILFLNVTKLE